MNRSIHRLYGAVIVAFAILAAFLAWWQIVRASDLGDRADNPYSFERERKVDRGRIITADGTVLARSVPVKSGTGTVYRRVYPNGTLAPHVVGYATPELGRTGVEAAMNTYLGGSYGAQPLLERLNLDTKQGADVQLSLKKRVQEAANAGLASTGRPGAVVAMNPKSGAILAMASNPSFDLRQVAGDFASISSRPNAPLLNRATQNRQPPGSTFKVVTATAAIDAGIATPESTYDDTGSITINGQPITNFGHEVFGRNTLTQALTHSINTTFAGLGQELGPHRLGETMTRFGFGLRPEVEGLPSSQVVTSGRFQGGTLLPNGEQGIDAARVAIGQERLLATPLQMAMVASAVANEGRIQRPYVVVRVRSRSGDIVRQTRPETLYRAMSADVAQQISDMMRSVVEEGTGTAAALSGLSVAGKTGTAEVPGGNMAWFIGFAPANDPTVAVAVRVEDTTNTGGAVAAPIAAQVMRAALGGS